MEGGRSQAQFLLNVPKHIEVAGADSPRRRHNESQPVASTSRSSFNQSQQDSISFNQFQSDSISCNQIQPAATRFNQSQQDSNSFNQLQQDSIRFNLLQQDLVSSNLLQLIESSCNKIQIVSIRCNKIQSVASDSVHKHYVAYWLISVRSDPFVQSDLFLCKSI